MVLFLTLVGERHKEADDHWVITFGDIFYVNPGVDSLCP